MTEFGADEIRDFTKLKRLREAGYFESEGSVPMPEIVADGGESALRDLLRERRVPVAPDRARKYAQTNMFCTNCDRLTQHGQVATYENTGQPVFHCNICCKCHLCLERLSGAQRLYEAVNSVGDKLAAWEAGGGAVSSPTFCTDCGAMLRCSVCVSTGPGGYCRGCGQKGCAIEGCDAS
ncbi:hypothetical protein LCGC14_2276150 [marine sediment metagenome]|uniref:Uncharacterized protein n=1 Tax=marine sediment metagenome TaxID=412755 RepID=A0A0F9DHR8_9ZZZZ